MVCHEGVSNMLSVADQLRMRALRLIGLLSLFVLAACDPAAIGGDTGPRVNPDREVTVALLVPGGSAQPTDQLLATNFENAARLAISDLDGVQIDLRVYNTGGNAQQAASVAAQAASDGAKIILGPLYGEAANAAGVAVAGRNINVLAFSNNASIAGGNVFVLGPTFENTANRLVSYSRQQGVNSMMIVHAQGLAGEIGRNAIRGAADRNGMTVSSVESYSFSQQGIFDAARRIATTAQTTGTDAVFMTAGPEADLPFLATALPEAGLTTENTTFLGLTRWSAQPQVLSLPGLQGGYFTQPDQALERNFQARYSAAFGSRPHPLAGLAYDGIAAIGALLDAGHSDALTRSQLTRGSGFVGTQGIFRLRADGTNERGLAVAQVRNNQVTIVDPAPKSFGGAGF